MTCAINNKNDDKKSGWGNAKDKKQRVCTHCDTSTDCQLGSERSVKPVWTVRKSLIPIAPATLARTSVQGQNRQSKRNAGEQHEFARDLFESYESRRRGCISRFLRSWRKLRHLHIKTESRRSEWMFRCLWAGWLHIEVIRLVPHE